MALCILCPIRNCTRQRRAHAHRALLHQALLAHVHWAIWCHAERLGPSGQRGLTLGFSTKRSTLPLSSVTTTPYLEGSSTWVTRMVPSAPLFLWNASSSFSGNSQMTSLRHAHVLMSASCVPPTAADGSKVENTERLACACHLLTSSSLCL